ncbi:recombinase family protein [uncultured Vagococcus sp.]|uniref:recombinase family protein n=1 Tax=uncultured Vagococcus sp. TaxID=189676 RepID=UPI0028D39811|nr:recombinase family protein [uncultured Vagococcus sp.]
MTVFGYARKGYPSEITTQINQLMCYACDKIFVENMNFDEDEEQKKLVSELLPEDVVVVVSLAVFGKTLRELTVFFDVLFDKKIRVISLEDKIDSHHHYSFREIAIALSEVDSKFKSQNTKQRLAISKSLGKSLGRPTISDEKIEKIQQLHRQKRMSYREISDFCQVSIGSVHKYLKAEVEV